MLIFIPTLKKHNIRNLNDWRIGQNRAICRFVYRTFMLGNFRGRREQKCKNVYRNGKARDILEEYKNVYESGPTANCALAQFVLELSSVHMRDSSQCLVCSLFNTWATTNTMWSRWGRLKAASRLQKSFAEPTKSWQMQERSVFTITSPIFEWEKLHPINIPISKHMALLISRIQLFIDLPCGGDSNEVRQHVTAFPLEQYYSTYTYT